MNILKNLRYTEDHEWVDANENIVTIGLSDFAQQALGDIVFVELPEVGRQLNKGDSFGVVESIKSVSDIFTPVSGEVIEINTELPDSPDKLNQDPYGSWLIKIKISNPSEIENLMDSTKYEEHCSK